MKSLLIIILAYFSMAFGEKHSTVEVQSKVQEQKAALDFKIKADDSYMITIEAPWSITLSKPSGLSFKNKKEVFKSKNMNKELPGFKEELQLDPSAKKHSFDYKIKAFVCTKDKKRCFPQTLKGSYEVTREQIKR